MDNPVSKALLNCPEYGGKRPSPERRDFTAQVGRMVLAIEGAGMNEDEREELARKIAAGVAERSLDRSVYAGGREQVVVK